MSLSSRRGSAACLDRDRQLGQAGPELGARFTFEHTGFTGLGGFFMAKLLGRVRTKMLTVGLAAVLDDLDDDGILRASSALRPTPVP